MLLNKEECEEKKTKSFQKVQTKWASALQNNNKFDSETLVPPTRLEDGKACRDSEGVAVP